MAMNQCRQNYHSESEAAVNRQINLELHASYCYECMASYFDRDDVALRGFGQYFKKASDEKRKHGEKLMEYQNKRGGRVVLQEIKRPDADGWSTGLDALQQALLLEKRSNHALLDLRAIAENHNDNEMTSFVDDCYLQGQVNVIKELGDHITNLRSAGEGLGEFVYDKTLISS